MATLNHLLNVLFDLLYVPLHLLPRWFSLTLLSAVVGVVALWVVKRFSNQEAIGQIKDDIKANLLAVKLFKDELRVMFRAQGKLIWAAARMQYRMLPPLLVMFVPFVLIAVQMSMRYEWRPLHVEEEAVVTAVLRDDARRGDFDLRIAPQEAFEVRDRVRAVSAHLVSWRVRPTQAGVFTLELTNGTDLFTKRLAVGEGIDRVCPVRPGRSFVDELLYPAEPPFAADSLVQSIHLDNFPKRDSFYAGAMWWLIWFVVVSMIFAFIFKPIFKVKF